MGFSAVSPVRVTSSTATGSFLQRSVPSTSIPRALDAAPRARRPRSGDRLPRMAPVMEDQGSERTVDLARYPLASRTFRERCRLELDHEGALVLPGFMLAPAVNDALSQSLAREGDAFFCTKSHNVFLLSPDPDLHGEHPRNREVSSSKGILADDQIDPRSPLRALYDSPLFREFLRSVTGANGALHPYADSLASVNVHVQRAGQELGWHFDNSSFAATVMLRPASVGGLFQYCPGTDRVLPGGRTRGDGGGGEVPGRRRSGQDADAGTGRSHDLPGGGGEPCTGSRPPATTARPGSSPCWLTTRSPTGGCRPPRG